MPKIINEPINPINQQEHPIWNYSKSQYNLSHPRYSFQENYKRRKIFKINYSYYPYLQIIEKLSYEENAMNIYKSTGILNITMFENIYFQNYTNINILKLNQIHLSMSMDNYYSDLALISIASILNVSKPYTFIHFHILCLNFGFKEIKKIIDLRRLNNKSILFFIMQSKLYMIFIKVKKIKEDLETMQKYYHLK